MFNKINKNPPSRMLFLWFSRSIAACRGHVDELDTNVLRPFPVLTCCIGQSLLPPTFRFSTCVTAPIFSVLRFLQDLTFYILRSLLALAL